MCKKIVVLAALFVLSGLVPVSANGYVPEGFGTFFDSVVPLFESILALFGAIFSVILNLLMGIYNQYSFVGLLVVLVVVILVCFILARLFRLIRLLFRKIKRFFMEITGLAEKRRQKVDRYRKETLAKKQDYEDLIKFHNAERKQTAAPNWDEQIAKVVDQFIETGTMDISIDEGMWDDMIAGLAPYDEKIIEIEKKVFTIEDRIHLLVAKIATLTKQQLIVEIARLRVHFIILNRNLEYLDKLQAAFPDDTDIASLVELSGAFIKATKGVEKGFIAALAK
ncbi:MAG: hypothetical protein FWG65_05170 [Turicibacter sp.]|nr:hypothetical protein [Turicibacter sp.]